MGVFGNLRNKLKGKSIEQEIDEAFDGAGTYSKKVLDASNMQANGGRFGMSGSYFHERQPQAGQQAEGGQDFDNMPGAGTQVPEYPEYPSDSRLAMADPTKMNDPRLNTAPPGTLPPLKEQRIQAQETAAQAFQQDIPGGQIAQQQTQQQPFNDITPYQQQGQAYAPDSDSLPRRIESLILEVRTLRSQTEQVLEIVRHLEKRAL